MDYGARAAPLRRGAGGPGTGMPSLRAFSSPWQLCPMGSTAGVARPLASQEPWPPRACEPWLCWSPLSGLCQLACRRPPGLPVFVAAAALKPTPRLGSFPRAWRLKHLQGHLSGVSAGRLLHWCWERGAMVMLHALRVTQPVTLPPCLPGSAPRDLPLMSPRAVSLFSSTVSSRPHPGVAPPSPHSSSLPPCLPGDWWPCPGHAGLRQGLSLWNSVHPGSQVSCCTLNGPLLPLCPK